MAASPLVDTHCHLADSKLYPDLDSVLERAAAAGVSLIITVGALGSNEANRLTVDIAERHPGIGAVVGIHPHDAKACSPAHLSQLRELAHSQRVVAIGETGLDFYYMRSPREAQEDSLRRHLELAAELGLPIVVHCRGAERRLAEIVREVGMPPAGGVIHCFTGDMDAAREFLALGFYVSFSGILTFKNAEAVRRAAAIVPDERVLVETDAPYLAPEPFRGRRNEPAYVRYTIDALARLRNVAPDVLGARIMANATRLFRIAPVRAVGPSAGM